MTRAEAAPGRLERLRQRLLEEPPPLRAARGCRTALRTAHVLSFAALYGGHVHGLEGPQLLPSLLATLGSGAALMAFEVYRARRWLVQVRGVATFAKLALVAGVGLFWEWRVALLTCAVVLGVVTSHMPGRYRYYSLLHGRAIGHGGNG